MGDVRNRRAVRAAVGKSAVEAEQGVSDGVRDHLTEREGDV